MIASAFYDSANRIFAIDAMTTEPAPISEYVPARMLTPLIGRVWEVAEVGALLRDRSTRLLTLTGPGGVGKTRLAMRLAEQTEDHFSQGIVFVPLSSVQNPAAIIPAIAESLGVPSKGTGDLAERIGHFLDERRVLLILDNFEHLLGGALDISALLRATRLPKLLITSRAPLHIGGEQEFPVGPLALPDAQVPVAPESVERSDAGALFLQRARAVQPDFSIDNANAAAVAEICQKLDGLPLAIELAASRIKYLSPQGLATRLSDRLHLLTAGPQDAPARLQTMKAAIAWSYDLLTPSEQELFRHLSVFPSGFRLSAAESVSEIAESTQLLTGLVSLIDSSLLVQTADSGGEPRFYMLETIRLFGLEQLSEQELSMVLERLSQWLDRYLDALQQGLRTRVNLGHWLDLIESELDTIRVVFDWYQSSNNSASVLRLCAQMHWFWYIRGFLKEGREQIERGLRNSIASVDEETLGRVYLAGAMLAHYQGEDNPAETWIRQAIDVSTRAGDHWTMVMATGVLGLLFEDRGDFRNAQTPLQQAAELAKTHQIQASYALAVDHLGVVDLGRGQRDQAEEHFELALAMHRDVGDMWGASIALSYLGMMACERGEFEKALRLQHESLAYRWDVRNIEDVAHGLSNVAMVAAGLRSFALAARLFGCAEATHELIGHTVKEPEASIYVDWISKTRSGMPSDEFAHNWKLGRELRLDEAVAQALAPIDFAADTSARPFDLTARELDVLQLLAHGKTDREISEALFISVRTAQSHVSHVLGKMGVSTRSAATGIAIRENLVRS